MNNLTTEQGRKEAAEKSKSMSQAKFTPAPWYPINYAGYWSIQPVNYYSPSDLLDSDKDKNAKANAKLMAAAPDLYEALQECGEALEFFMAKCGVHVQSASPKSDGEDYGYLSLLERLKPILAKARGEQTTQP